MKFKLIDFPNWNRKEFFDHYLNNVSCTYSMTLNLDITLLLKVIKNKNIKLYPVTIYLLSAVVNRHEEFRTAIDADGKVGIFDVLSPAYTIFQKESETFTNIWTEYNMNFSAFYADYLTDVQQYGEIRQFFAKPHVPSNIFTISSIPWVTFTGFNLNLPKLTDYLVPIFTTGKYFEQNDKIWLPIAIQMHHAVCDGFHLARFVDELQEDMNNFERILSEQQ
ncbi:MAG: type A chloramphenicol O-acetyltransferase [Verrucomicrobia bacterium]|nr:type A chloramphenicol O-acetyltransferase [Verrucomicrobiota bacterium]MBS0645806.1 type A chloramphenicol O-acetyltransferase [Verrucomicrobiota bacterium]